MPLKEKLVGIVDIFTIKPEKRNQIDFLKCKIHIEYYLIDCAMRGGFSCNIGFTNNIEKAPKNVFYLGTIKDFEAARIITKKLEEWLEKEKLKVHSICAKFPFYYYCSLDINW